MQIEQPAELNRHMDPTMPLTWTVRWQALKPGLPALLFTWVLAGEMLVLRLWLNDRSLWWALPVLLGCAAALFVLMLAIFEVEVRIAHRTKRRLQLEPKRVSFSPAEYGRIPWRQVLAWRLEPLVAAPGLRKLTLEYSLGRKSKARQEWPIILRQPDQEHALLSELEHLRQVGANTAPVIQLSQLSEPRPRTVSRPRLRPMAAMLLGCWCLVHGLPLLGGGLARPSSQPDKPPARAEFTPREEAKLQRTAVRLFSSPHQFRLFLLAAGGGLTALGAALYIWVLTSRGPSGLSSRLTSADKVG